MTPASARHLDGRADVHAGGREPGRLLPALAGFGAAPGRNPWCATRSSARRLENRRYGYRRIAAQLRREGLVVNRKRVLRLMRAGQPAVPQGQSPSCRPRPNARHGWQVMPNLARGNLVLTGLDQLWVADITYVRLLEEFAYSRHRAGCLQPAGHRLGPGGACAGWPHGGGARHGAEGPAARLMAVSSTIPIGAYNMPVADYTTVLGRHGIQASMSRVGNPYDNAKRRELHEDPQARGDRRARLPRHPMRPPGDRTLHRAGLQSPAAPFRARLSTAGGVRGKLAAIWGCCAAAPDGIDRNLSQVLRVSREGCSPGSRRCASAR